MVGYTFTFNMNTTIQRGEQQLSSGLYCRTKNSI